jgi:hypothetical protein
MEGFENTKIFAKTWAKTKIFAKTLMFHENRSFSQNHPWNKIFRKKNVSLQLSQNEIS